MSNTAEYVSKIQSSKKYLPRRKYINIWPRASRSSLRLCSVRWGTMRDITDAQAVRGSKIKLMYNSNPEGVRTASKMGVDAHIASCAGEAFVLAIRNVATSVRVDVLLCESKI